MRENSIDLRLRSFDPIENLSPELFDLIFQHLSPKQLMNCSYVSRTWHEEIGNSQNMKRIKVFIYHHTQNELNESLSRLFLSERKYRNISVNLGTMMFDEKVEQIARESSVKYRNVKFSDAKLYNSLWPIEVIANTVRDLSLCNIQCNLECNSVECLTFPHLKHLTLYKNSENIDKLFIECHDLITFNYTEKDDVNDMRVIENLLMNNSGLKVLGLRIVKCSQALYKVVSKCKFKLERFSFYAYKLNARMQSDNQNLLCEFLENQKDCLEILNIDQWCGVNALKLIFNIETLNNLSFNINHKGETINYIHINSNPAINRIDISEMIETDSIVLSEVLKAVPNIIIYKTCLMQYNDMMILERHCPNLRELYVEDFSVMALPPYSDSFSKLTKFKSLDINTEIVMLIISKDEEKRGHFEELILACYTRMFCDVLSSIVN